MNIKKRVKAVLKKTALTLTYYILVMFQLWNTFIAVLTISAVRFCEF